MWKFLDNAEGKTKAENMRFAAENLRALVGVAPTLLKLSIGEDVLGSPASFDMALVADFKSVEDMLAYRDFPRHAEISNYIRRVISDRKVVDFCIKIIHIIHRFVWITRPNSVKMWITCPNRGVFCKKCLLNAALNVDKLRI